MRHPEEEFAVNRILEGDVRERIREVPDRFINCIMFSPPYWRQRDYKDPAQIGMEPDYNLYLMNMWGVFDELWRVLSPDRTMWVNLWDPYWSAKGCVRGTGSKKSLMGHRYGESGIGTIHTGNRGDYPCLKPKTLLMLPELMILGLIDPEVRAFVEWRATGRPGNMLEKMIGAAGKNSMMLRNKCVWHKPNPGPESARDRLSRVWEYVFFLTKSRKYYFDLDAVRVPHKEASIRKWEGKTRSCPRYINSPGYHEQYLAGQKWLAAGGRNPGDFLSVSTRISGVPHYSAYPPDLCELPLRAGCPRWICKRCGEPRVRITRQERINTRPGRNVSSDKLTRTAEDPKRHLHDKGWTVRRQRVKYHTIGWSDCGCGGGFRPGIVLDPFSGTGTTLAKAKELGLDYLGIELKHEFCGYSKNKVGKVVRQEEFEYAV